MSEDGERKNERFNSRKSCANIEKDFSPVNSVKKLIISNYYQKIDFTQLKNVPELILANCSSFFNVSFSCMLDLDDFLS